MPGEALPQWPPGCAWSRKDTQPACANLLLQVCPALLPVAQPSVPREPRDTPCWPYRTAAQPSFTWLTLWPCCPDASDPPCLCLAKSSRGSFSWPQERGDAEHHRSSHLPHCCMLSLYSWTHRSWTHRSTYSTQGCQSPQKSISQALRIIYFSSRAGL